MKRLLILMIVAAMFAMMSFGAGAVTVDGELTTEVEADADADADADAQAEADSGTDDGSSDGSSTETEVDTEECEGEDWENHGDYVSCHAQTDEGK